MGCSTSRGGFKSDYGSVTEYGNRGEVKNGRKEPEWVDGHHPKLLNGVLNDERVGKL